MNEILYIFEINANIEDFKLIACAKNQKQPKSMKNPPKINSTSKDCFAWKFTQKENRKCEENDAQVKSLQNTIYC